MMVLDSCCKYRNGTVSLEELKGVVWETAHAVESSDEYDLRKKLQAIEGRLDMVQFSTDSDKVFLTTLPIVEELEELANGVM